MAINQSFIFLYGPPASGKSSVGRSLSADLSLPFYDLDDEIEAQSRKTIPDIFADEGESGFRNRETQALKDILNRPAGVVALGGGALLRAENRKLAETLGRVICLSSTLETIVRRLDGDGGGRPLLDGDAQEKLRYLLNQRRAHYASFPNSLVNESRPVEEIAWEAQVKLGTFRIEGMGKGYDVRVAGGSLENMGEMLRYCGLSGPLALVSDENVAGFHGAKALESLLAAGYEARMVILPAGEQHKTFSTVERLLERFLDSGLERSSTVIALGGGVVGDLAGFAAAVYLRGVRWVAVPSSLLAMVDASLGGKTGADLAQGKNLVGAFHPPALVLADPQVLTTLPEAELRNGLAEVVKHGVIGDAELFEACRRGLNHLNEDLAQIVCKAMAVKIRVVQEDPFEQGKRAVLNLGHTLGHGLEHATSFQLKHGEAVAIGMVAAARLSEKLKIGTPGLAEEIAACLDGLGLPTRIPEGIDRERLRAAMRLDKKRKAGSLRVVLPERIGTARWGIEIDDPDDLTKALEEERQG
jgi:3-dehydroquinate synthase